MSDFDVKAQFSADASPYINALQEAIAKLEQLGTKGKEGGASVKAGMKEAKSGANMLKDGLMELLPVMGVAMAVEKAIEFGKAIFEASNKHKKAVIDLGQAIAASGVKNVDGFVKKEEEFADALQNSTNISRDQILALEATETAMGISKDKLEDTTKAAEGLSKVTGGDAQSSIKYLTMATEGHFTMLQRYIPTLASCKTQAEKMALVMKTAQTGLNELTAETKEGEGPSKKLGLMWEDLQVKMGDALGKALNPLFEKLQQFMPTIEKVGKVIIDFVKIALDPAIASFKAMFDIANAIGDVLTGKFKKAWGDLKSAVKDGVDGVKNAVTDVKGAVTDAKAAYDQANEDATKTMEVSAPTINVNNVGAGHGGGGPKEKKEKVKIVPYVDNSALGVVMDNLENVQQAMDKAKLHAQVFGDSQLTTLKSEISKVNELMNKAFDKNDIQSADAYGVALRGLVAQEKALEDAAERQKEMLKQQKKAMDDMKKSVDDNAKAMENMAIKMGDAGGQAVNMIGKLATGKMSVQDLFKGLIGQLGKALGDFLKKKGEMLMKAGVFDIIAGNALIASSLGANPLGYQQVSQGTGEETSGTALIAAGSVISAIKMASGGIVHGSTLANIGEYPGASHNPEVVAPLDKLRSMMGGNQHSFAPVEIHGSMLKLAIDNHNKETGFSGNG